MFHMVFLKDAKKYLCFRYVLGLIIIFNYYPILIDTVIICCQAQIHMQITAEANSRVTFVFMLSASVDVPESTNLPFSLKLI